MPRTVPEIVVPVDTPPDVGAVGAALDGPVGDAGPWLPQAPARTPNERTNEMVIARTVFSSKCVVFTANVHGRDVKAHGTSPRTIAGKLNAIWSMHAGAARELFYQFPDHILRIAEQHPRAIAEVQLVVDACKSRILAPFDGKHAARLVGVDDRHAVNRTRFLRARGGVDDVVGADDE